MGNNNKRGHSDVILICAPFFSFVLLTFFFLIPEVLHRQYLLAVNTCYIGLIVYERLKCIWLGVEVDYAVGLVDETRSIAYGVLVEVHEGIIVSVLLGPWIIPTVVVIVDRIGRKKDVLVADDASYSA